MPETVTPGIGKKNISTKDKYQRLIFICKKNLRNIKKHFISHFAKSGSYFITDFIKDLIFYFFGAIGHAF